MTRDEYRAHLDALRARHGGRIPQRDEIPHVTRRIRAWLARDRVQLACGHIEDRTGAQLAQRCWQCGMARLERRARQAGISR